MLVNTSFNVRGEPIVCTVEDAYRCFMKSDMDVLVVENFVLSKQEQPPYERRSKIIKAPKSFWQKLLFVWSVVTYPIRWSVSKAVLSLIFLLVITPIGYGARKLNRLSIGHRRDGAASYWKARSKPTEKPGYLKQY